MMNEYISGETPGGLPPEPVEERENVSTVLPEEYPDPANGKEVAGRSDAAECLRSKRRTSRSRAQAQDD